MFDSFYYRVSDLPERPDNSLLATHIRENFYDIFYERESRVNLLKAVKKNPIKYVIRHWFLSQIAEKIGGEIKYQLVYKQILDSEGIVDPLVHELVQNFVGDSGNYYKFQDMYNLMKSGKFGALMENSRTWIALDRTRKWSELWRFRLNPVKYAYNKVWTKVFGYRGYDESSKFVSGRYANLLNPAKCPWVGNPSMNHPLFTQGPLNRFTPGGFLKPLVQKYVYTPLQVGKWVGGAKTFVKGLGKKVAGAIVNAGARVAVRLGLKTAFTALLTAVGTTLAGPIGTVVAFVGGEIVMKLAGVVIGPLMEILKLVVIIIIGLNLAFVFSVIVVSRSAFLKFTGGGAEGGPGMPGGSPYIEIIKTADPAGPFENLTGGKSQAVNFTITVENKADEKMTNIKVIDTGLTSEFEKECLISELAHGEKSDPSLCTFSVILTDIENTSVTNTAKVTAELEGERVSAATALSLKVGDPPTQAPCGWPVPSKKITQTCNKYHKPRNAIDMKAGMKTPIVATMDGVAKRCVVSTGIRDGKSYGIYIWLENEGYATLYAHLLKEAADPAGPGTLPGVCRSLGHFKKGDIIALSDDTGRSTGPHLHYEVYRSGNLVCPHTSPHNSFLIETVADCKK